MKFRNLALYGLIAFGIIGVGIAGITIVQYQATKEKACRYEDSPFLPDELQKRVQVNPLTQEEQITLTYAEFQGLLNQEAKEVGLHYCVASTQAGVLQLFIERTVFLWGTVSVKTTEGAPFVEATQVVVDGIDAPFWLGEANSRIHSLYNEYLFPDRINRRRIEKIEILPDGIVLHITVKGV